MLQQLRTPRFCSPNADDEARIASSARIASNTSNAAEDQ
jgi:hypothetical protein